MATDARALANSRRDLALGRRQIGSVRRTFHGESRRVIRRAVDGKDPTGGVDASEWVETIAGIWVAAIRSVWDETIDQIAADLEPKAADFLEVKATQLETVRQLLLRLTGDGSTSRAVSRIINGRGMQVARLSSAGIQRAIRRAQNAGVSSEKALRALYRNWAGTRSQRIALQEALTATSSIQHSAAQHAAATVGILVVHKWGTTGDDHVRDTHARANGQVRALEVPFTVGGHQLKHPRDPAGPAQEVIACRCSETYRRKHKPRPKK